MRFLPAAVLALTVLATVLESNVVLAKKPSRPRPVPSSRRPSAPQSRGRATASRRRIDEEEEDEEEDILGFQDDVDDEEDEAGIFSEEDEEDIPPPRPSKAKKASRSRRPPASRAGKPSESRSPPRKRPSRRDYDDEEEEYDRPTQRSSRGPQPRRGPPGRGPPGRGRKPGSVVPYARPQPGGAASAFTRGISAIRGSMPDPSTVREAAVNSINAARQTTSSLTANIYREVKGLTSSELEQVMLKATKPDDTPVKGKHVERLVGVTYQISSRYDIYDAVLRKLWGKMIEKDWRTTMKSLYILHRFSADGAPEHAPALKARLRELRRTRDPKRKDKFFNSKQLLSGDSGPEDIKFRAYMSRYAHYVLLRAQCFGGMFDEISSQPKPEKKKAPKPITATAMRVEHLEAAIMLLKAGVVCQLKEGEECENTALAAERVASDLIGLTAAVAIALNRALKNDDLKGADPALLKRWCVFYSEELLPQTKSMVKKISPKLDAYGLFLPSRMGTSVSQELLEKGLHVDDDSTIASDSSVATADEPEESCKTKDEENEEEEEEEKSSGEEAAKPEALAEEETAEEEATLDDDASVDDEYEYEEEEYYDDEEE
jgi:hypothetical protein